MYVMKVYKKNKKEPSSIKYFRKFENAVAVVSEISAMLPNNITEDPAEPFGNPEIYYGSETADGTADDFEFRYQNGTIIYIGQILAEEDKYIPNIMLHSDCFKERENELEALCDSILLSYRAWKRDNEVFG